MAYFLAVDAGGTKADYVLADETQELARTRSGTIKRLRTDAATGASRIAEALQALEKQSGVSMADVTRTCVGTAGQRVPLVADFLRSELGSRVGGELLLRGDVEIALDAAFEDGPGVLVLAGTGSNVVGRTRSGTLTSAGGYGPVLSDQGSGYCIGHRALRQLFLAHDEGIATSLEPAILEHWSLDSIDDLVGFANASPLPDFSTLTHIVLRCAQAGDRVALRVLRCEGEELAYVARLVIRRVLKAEPETMPQIAFAGSVMEHVAPVREALIEAVQREFPSIHALHGVVDPVQGALWRARVGGVPS